MEQDHKKSVTMQSLQSPGPVQHSVFNHTLMSPHQVSISRAMPLDQCSRLIGGRQTIGSRVIENMAEGSVMVRDKEEGSKYDITFNDDHYLNKLFTKPANNQKVSTINLTCTSTKQTDVISFDLSTIETNDVDDNDEAEEDVCSDDDGSEIDGEDVEEFIQMQVEKKRESYRRTSVLEKAVNSSPEKRNVSVQSLETFLTKTDELIKQNLLLQQQIGTLKRETALQTKVLTKLLVKRSKKHTQKPYDENSLSS